MYYYCRIQRGLHLTKISVMIHPAGTSDGILTNATLSNVSDFGFIMAVYEKKSIYQEIREC